MIPNRGWMDGRGAGSGTASEKKKNRKGAEQGVTPPPLVLMGKGVGRRTKLWELDSEGPDATVQMH